MESLTAKKYGYDDLARDVAFEIQLGGDRFGPDDLAGEKMSLYELAVFKERIKYFAKDFVPESMDTDDFVAGAVESWVRFIQVDDRLAGDLRDEFREMQEHRDRGKWFAFYEGYLRCDLARKEDMWDAEFLKKNIRRQESVDTLTVAKEKAHRLLFGGGKYDPRRYGREVMMDGPVMTMDIESYGVVGDGSVLSLRAYVDILNNDDPKKTVFFLTHTTYDGDGQPTMRSRALSDLDQRELDALIGIMDTESDVRMGRTPEMYTPKIEFAEFVPVKVQCCYVLGCSGKDEVVLADSVSTDDHGNITVNGFVNVGGRKERTSIVLDYLSDKDIEKVAKATSHALSRIKGLVNRFEAGKEQSAGKMKARKETGPSL